MIELGIVQIVFCSHATDSQDTNKLNRNIKNIVQDARIKNAKLGITGALLTDKASFAQVAEGSFSSVEDMYSDVVNDKRHYGVELLQYVVTHVRLLPLRALAFVEVDRIPRIDEIKGYSTSLERRKACLSVLATLRPLLLR